MNNPFFDKNDLLLCEVPTPKGYPQSQTHSSIVLYEGRYYLTTSPYPGKKYSKNITRIRALLQRISLGLLCNPKRSESYENPCLYVGLSNDLTPPVIFKPLTEFPLMNTPESVYGLPSFNSDPELYIENGRVYILNRVIYRTKMLNPGYESLTDIFLIEGNVDNERFKLESIRLIKEWGKPYASPCLTKFRGKYLFTYLDTNSALDATTFNGLYMQKLDDIKELGEKNNFHKIRVNSNDLLPWHMSLFSHNDTLYTIIACVKKNDKSRKIWQMLGEFNADLSELTIYSTPLTDYNSYRGAACVKDDGLFVLYTTTLWEYVKGTRSVDGRDVLLAKCKFSDLLNHFKNV